MSTTPAPASGEPVVARDFYERLRAFLADQRPDLDGVIEPTTQLWEAGYLDSFGLVEMLSFLEELLGRRVEIGADDLPSFSTMEAIYRGFVAV